MRHTLALLCTFFAAETLATPIACPAVDDIQRVNGEYAWQSHNSLFEGYFAFPMVGRGQSSRVTQFLEARWIQLNDLNNPQGVVECDYAGNVAGEIVRFSLLNAQAGPKPNGYTWSCQYNPPFPSTQCVCQGDSGTCTFEKS